jgi:predicted urease superfamily metal-dependent hydrolase
MSANHTPGPWRWEYNAKHRAVHLVGGKPAFDLTVMDFARWGTQGAVPMFRDTAVDGMNMMDRLCDKPEWLAVEIGREHHKRWHMLVSHPDARLMEAAPDLLAALQFVMSAHGEQLSTAFEQAQAAIAKATGAAP